MAAYISVPRDLGKVKSKIFFNLTKRQLICFSIAAAVGVPLFFLVKKSGNVSLAVLCMMVVMLPFFFFPCTRRTGCRWRSSWITSSRRNSGGRRTGHTARTTITQPWYASIRRKRR